MKQIGRQEIRIINFLVISYFILPRNYAVFEPRTGHFRGLLGFEAKAKNFKMCPRGRPWLKDVLEDSTSGLTDQPYRLRYETNIQNKLSCSLLISTQKNICFFSKIQAFEKAHRLTPLFWVKKKTM